MAIDVHTVSVSNKSSRPLASPDRLFRVHLAATAYPAGAAGVTVTANITGLELPAKYHVLIGDTGAPVIAFITNRTQAGFTLNVAPLSGSVSVAAGSVDLVVEA